MKRLWLKILFAIPVLVLALAAAAWGTLLHTTTGAGWLLDVAEPYIPGRLGFGAMEGSLAGGLEFSQLSYDDDSASVRAGRAKVAVVPRFRPFALQVRYLEIGQFRYAIRDRGTVESKPFPESMELPFRIEIERLHVDGAEFLGADEEPLFRIDRLSAALSAQQRLELRNAELESPLGRLAAAGSVQLARPYAVDIDGDARLALESEDLPDPINVEARLRLGGSMGRFILDFDGSAASGRFDLVADGVLNLEAGTVDGRIAWSDFQWPLAASEPQFYSRSGRATASGRFEDWAVRGEAEVESPGLPEGTLSFDATGDREGLRAEIIEGRFLGGTLAGDALFSWTGERPFEVALEMDKVATGPLYPALPTVLSGVFTAKGQIEPLSVDADIGRLEGEVQGQALSASGHVSYSPGELSFRALDLVAGESHLVLDGSLDRPDGIRFDADVRDLSLFVDEAAGHFEGRGRLAMRAGNPQLELDLDGQGLRWRDLSLPDLRVRQRPPQRPDSLASLTIEARAPAMGQKALEEVLLDVEFGAARQDLALTIRNLDHAATASLSGAVRDLDAPLADWAWTGRLDALAFEAAGESLVKLEAPAGLDLAAAGINLDTACMAAGADSRICLEGQWRQDSGVVATLALEEAPLTLLTPLLGQEVEFTQQAQGELHFEMGPKGEYSGIADIRLTPGVLRFTDDNTTILQTGPGLVGFRLANGGLEAGNLFIPLPGQGEIDLDFRVPELADGLDAELEGRLLISMTDLDVLSAFLPMADEISGRLEADLALAGTAERPYSTGHIALADGLIANRTSGLRLSEIVLEGRMDGDGRTDMKGSFRATEGSGSLDAMIDLSDIFSPRVALGVRGADLKLFDSKDLTVVAEPDLRLEWKSGEILVDGRVTIPSARVAPAIIPASTVTESEDVNIVAGDLPDSDPKRTRKSRMAIFGALDLVLGNRVKVDLDVAEVAVTGNTRFEWQGALIPMANGSFETNGEILAFGQLLEITEGRVLFPNVLANDPHLSIQAEREIFGNSEIRRAGLLITGTLRRPVTEPYTDPMTNRERAQTLLITGSDFNMERGVGAVNIGTYIAPRIFVSYGLGVFEDENVISVRYDLGRGWGVKATSGERQTGLDISYTVDQ